MICSECNSADGKVKREFHSLIDRRFSFTFNEIGQFIRVNAQNDHDVDYDRAFEVWKSARESFEVRVNLVDRLLGEMDKGHIFRERGGQAPNTLICGEMRPSNVLLDTFRRDAKESERYRLLYNFRSEFIARSTSRDSAQLPRRASSKHSDRPTEIEFEKYIDRVSEKRWQRTPSNWNTPICERSKKEIIRKSKNGAWTGGIREKIEYIDEEDFEKIKIRKILFPNFKNEYWIARTQSNSICSECSEITARVSQTDPSLTEPYLKLQDLQDCIVDTAPHQRHQIDFDLARQRSVRNEGYRSAATALDAYNSLLSKVHLQMKIWSDRGMPRSKIIYELCEDLRVYNNIEDGTVREEIVKWLLKQEARKPETE